MSIPVIKLTDLSKVEDVDGGVIEFHIPYWSDDYTNVKKLCQHNEPIDVILLWQEYKNIKYGLFLESFMMENSSFSIGQFSTFYGRAKNSRRISKREYTAYARKNKIQLILNSSNDNDNEVSSSL